MTDKSMIGRSGFAMLEGFTMIEIAVVMVIVGILAVFVMTTFTGASRKSGSEGDIKQMYSVLNEMRAKSWGEHRVYGLYWTASPFTAFDVVLCNTGTVTWLAADCPSPSPAPVWTTKTVALDNPSRPLNVSEATGILFSERGLTKTSALTDANKTLYFYAECASCDQGGTDYLADRSASCNDVSYPEYSCITVSLSYIKMGKWCDANTDNAFDSGECQIR